MKLYPAAPDFPGWRQRRNDIPMMAGVAILQYRKDGQALRLPADMPAWAILGAVANGRIPLGTWTRHTIDYTTGQYALYEPSDGLHHHDLNKHHSQPHPFFTKE